MNAVVARGSFGASVARQVPGKKGNAMRPPETVTFGESMIDPTITCPNCKTEIKFTESLAAPLIEATRKRLEEQTAAKDAEVARREESVREERLALAKARETLDQQVTARLNTERTAIAAEEARKARLLLAGDLETKNRELSDLQEVLKQRDEKLAEAQKAQAELIRKQRELDDAKREMDLTIETRVQESLDNVRNKARLEAEESLRLKVAEKETTISAMQRQIEDLKRRAEQGSQHLDRNAQGAGTVECHRGRGWY